MMKKFRDGQSIGYEAPRNSNRHPRHWFHCREIIVSEATGRRIVTIYNHEIHGAKDGKSQQTV